MFVYNDDADNADADADADNSDADADADNADAYVDADKSSVNYIGFVLFVVVDFETVPSILKFFVDVNNINIFLEDDIVMISFHFRILYFYNYHNYTFVCSNLFFYLS